MRGALVFCVWLLGCGQESDEDDMSMRESRRIHGIPRGEIVPEQWGQQRVFPIGQLPSRQAGGSPMLKLNPLPKWRVPRVQSMIVGVENLDADANQEYFLRWILSSGTGGARTEVVFDAVGFTRLALPLEQGGLALAYEPYSTANDSPAGVVTASAYIADFGVGELQPGPTYTALVQVAIAAPGVPTTQTIDLPTGANRFRLVGNPRLTVGPFRTTTFVSLVQGATTVAGYVGAGAAATDLNNLLALHYTGDFIPIPAGVSRVVVENSDVANGIFGFIQFGLDL